MNKRQSLIDRAWKDNKNKQAIIAWPNIPLVCWFVFMLVTKLLAPGRPKEISENLAFGFLFTWAWLEIYSGKSYFRRILGLLVITYIIYCKTV